MVRMPNLVLVLRLKVTYNKIEVRIMKKTIILLFVALAFFITVASPIYAGKESPLFPSWFTNAIKPIQNSINSLFQRIDSHGARISELEKKVDFNIPSGWNVSFYQEQNGKDTIIM